ncbi:hypothetical protein [Magnetococcus sp. PR-3]|uniref:hypothetical protein n=1 Tax=Magnetococcus sp. PR-3 TaxID=3120355 RepID=UPI002FCDE5AB
MTAQRMLFLTVALLLWTGIYLTGFQMVHWLLLILAGLVSFAGLTGFCPTYWVFRKIGFAA